ncbi:hypothetical protein C8J27_102434 [Rhodobacter aestuarii]|uniref:DUF1150 family protein n=1 Tax=Rhodobacter aestuarii TaxID=453582 RepID=A0A1N7MP13_9RHOB|nr:DUF1150 family protein [Rhodobacter aestuarii]PTV96631.1 hypothetical protein C8J27_102434 [Rhodobacter aestuarii]SIS87885.1 hypothetical protein SAMN05421580_10687 [Rhodobacter aestuarii]
MDHKFDFGPAMGGSGDERIVYVRPVAVSDLPADIQKQAGGLTQLYALHDANGERLALVKDRWMAFHLARENEALAFSVH